MSSGNEYASKEASAEDRLNSGELSAGEEKDAKDIVDSVTGGEPEADWKRRVDTADYKAHPMTSAARSARSFWT